MPLMTREIRWFFDGSLADTGAATAAWFTQSVARGEKSPAISPEDWRTDRYLFLPQVDDLGIKLRQDRWEIKGRHALIGIQRFGEGIEGEVACWTKWAIAAPGESGGGHSAIAACAIVDIAKQRIRRAARFTQDGAFEIAARQENAAREIDRGLHMELTRIRVAGARRDSHWSLGFEAFPDDPSACALFAEAICALLEGCPAKPLSAEGSMSYPRWLQRLGARIKPGAC